MPLPSKYRNVKTEVDGIVFDSKREAKRYSELKLLEKTGEIHSLELQPRYLCMVNDVLICTYRGDFFYGTKNGEQVLEDVKGMKTPVYRLKKKLVKALFGVEVVEV